MKFDNPKLFEKGDLFIIGYQQFYKRNAGTDKGGRETRKWLSFTSKNMLKSGGKSLKMSLRDISMALKS